MNAGPFETPRLRIACWDVALAEQAFGIYSDPRVTQFLGNKWPTNVEETRERIESIIERNSSLAAGLGSWPMFERESGRMVGTILLKPLPEFEDVEVGWHLAVWAWGNGYATEAGKAAVKHGFDQVGLSSIYAVVDPANARSKQVCLRIGMTHLGRTSKYYERELDFFQIDAPVSRSGVAETE